MLLFNQEQITQLLVNADKASKTHHLLLTKNALLTTVILTIQNS